MESRLENDVNDTETRHVRKREKEKGNFCARFTRGNGPNRFNAFDTKLFEEEKKKKKNVWHEKKQYEENRNKKKTLEAEAKPIT